MRGYSLSELLVDHYYRSRTRGEGVIIRAEKRDNIYDADYAFAVEVRQSNGETFWSTVFIDTEAY